MSIRAHSSNGIFVRRSWTCQIQVRPGVTSNRRFCHGSQASVSSHGSGRGPTMDMSPRSTFHNCGNSSILVLRIMWPIRVIRGSCSILNAGPSCSFSLSRSALRSSASTTMDRNWYIRNGLPPRPLRRWQNSTGPGEDSLAFEDIQN